MTEPISDKRLAHEKWKADLQVGKSTTTADGSFVTLNRNEWDAILARIKADATLLKAKDEWQQEPFIKESTTNDTWLFWRARAMGEPRQLPLLPTPRRDRFDATKHAEPLPDDTSWEPEETVLLVLLEREARGMANAMRVEDLRDRLQWSERRVRNVARNLVIRHGAPIGSSTGGSYGNPNGDGSRIKTRPGLYVICTPEERAKAVQQLDSRLRETYRRRRALHRATIEELVKQGVFDFNGEPGS